MNNDFMKEQKINIILKYGERIYYFETFKYKTLNILIEKAYKFFYPLNGEIELFWNNKNLTEFLDKPIGLVFNNQKKVKIIIKKSQFEIFNYDSNNNNKKSKNKIKNRMKMNFLYEKNNSTTNLNVPKNFMKNYDILNNKINNNNNEMNINKSLNNIFNNNNNNNSFVNMKSNFNGKKKLPPIKNNNNNNNNNNFNNNSNENNENNNNILCYECFKNQIFFYCRNDNIFLCNFCYNEKSKHFNHKVFYITNDIKKNINNYKEEMIRDLKETEFLYNNLYLLKNKEINIKNWEKTFENILENIKNVSEKLNKKISLNDDFILNNNNNSNTIENVDEEYERIRNDLDNINCDDKNKNPIEIFNRINKSEKEIENLFYNSKKYNKKKEIKEKIEKIYYDINNEIDNVIDYLNKEFEL